MNKPNSERTVHTRYRAGGEAGLAERSSGPHRPPAATPANAVEHNIAGYKVSPGISFVEEFPRNSQGKVLKQEPQALL